MSPQRTTETDMGYTIAIAALTAVAGVLAVVLWRTLAARVGERSAAEEALAAERAAVERLRGEVAGRAHSARVRVESELAALRESEQTSRRDREELERTMTAQFRSLAGEIFGEQSREFRRTNRESLDMLLKPFKDNITEFRERVERIYASENEQRGALKNELDNLMRLNVRMTAEATNLTNALRGNSKTQGDWGEVYLETILSSTGLVKGAALRRADQSQRRDGTQPATRCVAATTRRAVDRHRLKGVADSLCQLHGGRDGGGASPLDERACGLGKAPRAGAVGQGVSEARLLARLRHNVRPVGTGIFGGVETGSGDMVGCLSPQGNNIVAHQPLRAVENGRRHVASRCAEQESGGDRRQGHEALRAVGGLYRVVGGCRYGVGPGAHALRRRLPSGRIRATTISSVLASGCGVWGCRPRSGSRRVRSNHPEAEADE